MLAFDPDGYSLKHYEDFFTNTDWQIALWNSFIIAPAGDAARDVGVGTLAAIGLSQPHVPFRGAIMAMLISPMIVPLIISAAGMYFFYSPHRAAGHLSRRRAGACGARHALRHHHVTATLVGFDRSLIAGGAEPRRRPGARPSSRCRCR